MLTIYVGMVHLPMAATAWASSVFWLGCAADTQCGSAVFTLDSPAAASRELHYGLIDLLVRFPLRHLALLTVNSERRSVLDVCHSRYCR